nr:hypothetical protein [Tanacetum cinerariifolium]
TLVKGRLLEVTTAKQRLILPSIDDADGVDCFPTEENFVELARMGYEKPPPKLTFYKAFFSVQWKFLIHTLVQCMSAKRTAWNEFSCFMASAVICLTTGRKFNFSKYIFDSMVRNVDIPYKFLMIGKGFSGIETPLFATMLVQPQAAIEEEDMEDEEGGGRIKEIDADKDITLVDMETEVDLGVELHERLEEKDKVNAAAKEVNATEPTVFDDEEVTMTMAQTLIKIKAEKARLQDEQMAKRLHDEEVKHAATREKQEQDDFKRAQEL